MPFPPGGGWDTYARVAAKHITKYIPGRPSIIVQNVPGAGGLVGVNFLYNRVKPDGLTIGMFEQLFKEATPAVITELKKIMY